jgi:hypothetical protein
VTGIVIAEGRTLFQKGSMLFKSRWWYQNSSKTGLEMPIGYSTIAYGASNRVVFPAEVSSPAQSDFFNSI